MLALASWAAAVARRRLDASFSLPVSCRGISRGRPSIVLPRAAGGHRRAVSWVKVKTLHDHV